jgi:hypothetical protein
MSAEDDDAQIEAEIKVLEALADRALAPYLGRLPAAEYALLRDTLVDVLATHPNGQKLVEGLLPRAPVEVSGEVGGDADEREGGGQAKGGSGAA